MGANHHLAKESKEKGSEKAHLIIVKDVKEL